MLGQTLLGKQRSRAGLHRHSHCHSGLSSKTPGSLRSGPAYRGELAYTGLPSMLVCWRRAILPCTLKHPHMLPLSHCNPMQDDSRTFTCPATRSPRAPSSRRQGGAARWDLGFRILVFVWGGIWGGSSWAAVHRRCERACALVGFGAARRPELMRVHWLTTLPQLSGCAACSCVSGTSYCSAG